MVPVCARIGSLHLEVRNSHAQARGSIDNHEIYGLLNHPLNHNKRSVKIKVHPKMYLEVVVKISHAQQEDNHGGDDNLLTIH